MGSSQTLEAAETWLTVPEACKLLGVRRERLYSLIEGRYLTVLKIPGTYQKIAKSSCDALIRHSIEPAESAR